MRHKAKGANRRSEGHRVWLVPDAYLPPLNSEDEKNRASGSGYWSHESLCILNTSLRTAHVRVSFYFEDRAPKKDVLIQVGAERTRHVRFDQPEQLSGYRVPAGIPYALRIESNVPIVVQHSRLDTTQPNCAFLSVMACPMR